MSHPKEKKWLPKTLRPPVIEETTDCIHICNYQTKKFFCMTFYNCICCDVVEKRKVYHRSLFKDTTGDSQGIDSGTEEFVSGNKGIIGH